MNDTVVLFKKKTAPKQMDAWMSSRTYKWR